MTAAALPARAMPHVESTAILRIAYDDPARRLFVTFRESGRTYTYYGVPRRVYDSFISADSKGTFFNDCIRDRYPYSRD